MGVAGLRAGTLSHSFSSTFREQNGGEILNIIFPVRGSTLSLLIYTTIIIPYTCVVLYSLF